MKRLALLTFALALAMPAAAAAKEVESARVCGATQCTDVDDHDVAMGIVSGGNSAPPPGDKAGGWYSVSVVFNAEGERHRFALAAVPSERLLRTYDPDARRYSWMEMADEAVDAYREVTGGMEARPLSTLRGRNQKPPEVIVDEVVNPPVAGSAAGVPWGWIAGGASALLLLALAGVLIVRRSGGRRLGEQGT